MVSKIKNKNLLTDNIRNTEIAVMVEKNLQILANNHPIAYRVLKSILTNIIRGNNALIISNLDLAYITRVSVRSLTKATKYLANHQYIQIIKILSGNAYIVHKPVDLVSLDSLGQLTAVFSATVFVNERSQKPELSVNFTKSLKQVSLTMINN